MSPEERLEERLLEMKRQIEEAKIKQAKLQGELLHLKKEAKKEFGKDDLTSLKKILTQIDREIQKKQSILEKGIEELEENYDWD